MRRTFLITCSIAASVFSTSVFAEGGANVKVSFSKDAEKSFAEKYGPEEKAYIEASVREEIQKALGQDYSVEVFVESATPNRPTMFQMSKTPSLSFQSFSVGGVDLKGVVFDSSGKQLGEVQHKYSTPNVYDSQYAWVWYDADWAIEKFATKLKKSVQ